MRSSNCRTARLLVTSSSSDTAMAPPSSIRRRQRYEPGSAQHRSGGPRPRCWCLPPASPHDPHLLAGGPAAPTAAISNNLYLRHKHVLRHMPKPPWLCPGVRSKRGPVQLARLHANSCAAPRKERRLLMPSMPAPQARSLGRHRRRGRLRPTGRGRPVPREPPLPDPAKAGRARACRRAHRVPRPEGLRSGPEQRGRPP